MGVGVCYSLLLIKFNVHTESLAMTDTWSSAVTVGRCLEVVPKGPSIFCMTILALFLARAACLRQGLCAKHSSVFNTCWASPKQT
jgi:hypothetical protein